jgi:hypothetical protein
VLIGSAPGGLELERIDDPSMQTTSHELEDLARLAGERWAAVYALRLRTQRRAVEGAWPGTVSEAYGRVIGDLADRVRTLSEPHIRALSQITYRAARTAWVRLAVRESEH